jgi:hypothetical protein
MHLKTEICCREFIHWTSDVTNNYEDLDELYQELHDTWSRYVGHVVTNVGGNTKT